MLETTTDRNGPRAWLDEVFSSIQSVSDEGPHDDLTALGPTARTSGLGDTVLFEPGRVELGEVALTRVG